MSCQATKKVLLISPLPPPAGGIASWTQKIVDSGLPDGYTPVVLNTRVLQRQVTSRTSFSLGELYRTASIIGRLLRRLVSARPAVVHLNCSLSRRGIFRDLVCGCMVRLFRVSLVTHYHGNIPDFRRSDRRDWSYAALKALARLSHANIALNQGSLSELALIAHPCQLPPTVIPNLVDEQTLADANLRTRAENPRDGKRFRLLYAGAIQRSKGSAEVIEVAWLLPEVEFLMMGTVSDGFLPALRSLPPNLTVRTEADHQEVLAQMSRSDLLLFPSHSEGFPNAILEAMAVGLPIVASRVGAIPEMVEEERGGILVDTGDVPALAGAIRFLQVNPELRRSMGEFNRAKCRREYHYNVVALKLTGLYTRVMQMGRVAGAIRAGVARL